MDFFMDREEEEEGGPAVDAMFSCSHMTGNRSDCVIRLLSHYPVTEERVHSQVHAAKCYCN